MAPYRPIIGTLAYVMTPDHKSVLLIHRNAREEAGIECIDLLLRGTINWTGFGPQAEDWLAIILS